MIWMSGLDMGCFYFNRAWLDFRGRTLEQESGNGWAEGVHPEDLQRCVSHYVGCFEQRIAFAMSYRLLDHTGRYRWILDRGAPHSLPDGTFLGYFGGCAEIECESPLVRISELRTSLLVMKDFALRLATEQGRALTSLQGRPDTSLQAIVRARHGGQVETLRRKQHAAEQIAQLATDMLRFEKIEPGACLP